MNQLYAEAEVKKKEDMQSIIIKALLAAAVFVSLFVATLGSYFILISVAVIAGVFFLFPRLNVEYEYVFVDGQIDFDRIMGKAKRKTLLRIDMEQVEIVAQIGSHALDSYNNAQYVTKNFSSGDKSAKPFVIIASAEDKKYRILFEPSEKMITMMRQKSPRKISMI